MARLGRRLLFVGLLALTLAAITMPAATAQGPSGDAYGSLTLHVPPTGEHHAVIVPGPPGQPGRSWGYWGRFTGWRPGSYRATCAWLADPTWGTTHGRRDNRVLCTVLLSFCSGPGGLGQPNGGSLVLHGLVTRPGVHENLFEDRSTRRLALIGGTGVFSRATGTADLTTAHQITVRFDVARQLPAGYAGRCARRGPR